MLLLSEQLKNVPVMSLQTGTELARTTECIIDPRSLSIPALYVSGPQVDHPPAVLHTDDIREAGELGFIIDGSTKIMELDGLVRLNEIIGYGFSLLSCTVFDQLNTKLGVVSDFSFDPQNFAIQQIYIRQPFLKRFSSTSHIINRSQIVSITRDKIVVDTPINQEPAKESTESPTGFINPFRSQSPQPDQTDTD